MSEQFYWKKQRLALRDKLLEDIGRTVFNKDELPKDFTELPRIFRLKEQLMDQLRDRKVRLREARDETIAQLEVLEQKANEITQEFDEKILPFKLERDQVQLRLQHAEDLANKGSRSEAADHKNAEDWSCKINALDLRIQAGEKHYGDQLEAIKSEINPLRENLARHNQMIAKALDEEEHLKLEMRGRLKDLGYYYFSKRRQPEHFEEQYAALNKHIEELADYRKHPTREPLPEVKKRDNLFWRVLLAAVAIAAVILLLFRTQYRQGQINFGAVAQDLLPARDDYRLYLDLNQAHLESWYSEIPALESLPGGAVFSGMGRQDILAFMVSKENFGEGPVRFYGVKLRQSPARVSYRLAQQGWEREATRSGFEALSKDDKIWVILSDREFLLLPKAALAQLDAQLEGESSEIFRVERQITPFETHLALLHDLDQLVLTMDQNTYELALIASNPPADEALRQELLETKLAQNRVNDAIDIRFEKDRLVMKGTYDLKVMPFTKEELKTFVVEVLKPVLESKTVASERKDPVLPVLSNPLTGLGLPQVPPGTSQGVILYQVTNKGLKRVRSLRFGKALTDVVFLNDARSAMITDAGNQTLVKINVGNSQLQIDHQISLNAEAMDAFLGQRSAPFIPSRIFPTPNKDFAVLLEGEGGHTGRRRLMLVDLKSSRAVAVEELPSSVKRALVATWDEQGHDLFVGTETFARASAGATRILGYRREGHVLGLSKVIRAHPQEGRGGVAGLVYRPQSDDLYLHHVPSQTVSRYLLVQGSWQAGERVQLEPDSNQENTRPHLPGPTLVGSRNQRLAMVLDRRLEISEDDSYKVFLIDLTQNQPRLLAQLSLSGKPYAMVRLPLQDRFLVSIPSEGVLLELGYEKGADAKIQIKRRLQADGFSPASLASDPFGEWVMVTGQFETKP